MNRYSLALAAVLLGSLPPAHGEPELRGKAEELKTFLQSATRTVTLDQEATEKAYADRALLTLAVTTEDRVLAQALQANQSLRGSIMAALKQAGIPSADIRTSEFSTSPQYGWFGSKPSSYKVINTLVVRIADERLFQVVAGMTDRYKEVQLAGTQFEHSQKDQAEERVRKAALAKIMAEKQVFEKELGLHLRPVTFGTQRATDRGQVEEIVVTARKASAMSEPETFELPEGFSEIEYRARVSVTFEVTKAE